METKIEESAIHFEVDCPECQDCTDKIDKGRVVALVLGALILGFALGGLVFS